MERVLTPEWLDDLPPGDTQARKSRQDLQRINLLMGHVPLLSRWLVRGGAGWSFERLVELGAGDGSFALKLARRLTPQIGPLKITLVDRLNLISAETLREFKNLRWEPEFVLADLSDYSFVLPQDTEIGIIANLFLHHFTPEQLQALFAQAAKNSAFFAACDPRRSFISGIATRMLWAIGCNAVTRHDAVVSVQAGFRRNELSRLWPRSHSWHLVEKEAGRFSHLFVAMRAQRGTRR